MRLPGEEESRSGFPVIYMVVAASGVILVILLVALGGSLSSSGRRKGSAVQTVSPVPTEELTVQEEDLQLSTGSGLRVDDLDFWDMYPQEEEVIDSKKEVDPEMAEATPEPSPTATPDPAEDGKHTLIQYKDGTQEWVLINSYLTKNSYDFSRLKLQDDRMKYYQGEKVTSYFGVDISKYNGTVDFAKLKNNSVDFVMIRLGSRGYGSGQILLDENFHENMKGASEAGLNIGVYFFSQAITIEEATEEAAFVAENLTDYKVTYPVVFDMEYIENDISRIETLSKDAKTTIAATFMSSIQTAGYQPMIYGTKEWLIKEIDLTKLTMYDVWYSQQADIPDYPYQFQIWQYSLKGQIAGISGDVDFNISFVDYSAR